MDEKLIGISPRSSRKYEVTACDEEIMSWAENLSG